MEVRIALVLWLACVAGFMVYALARPAPVGQVIASSVAFALLMGLYLSFGGARAGEAVGRMTGRRLAWSLPVVLWVMFGALTLVASGPHAALSIALAAAYFWLPTALAIRGDGALTTPRAAAGLGALLLPLGADVALGARLDAWETALRAAAFALPVLLVLLTTGEQRNRLSFPFISAAMVLWFAVEFNGLPGLPLPLYGSPLTYMRLAAIVLLLYLLALTGRLAALGFTFSLTRADWREVGINLAWLAIILLPLGVLTGFVRLAGTLPGPLDMVGRALAIFFLIALPEEILFRGIIHRHLADVLRWRPWATLLLSSAIFGLAHLNDPPNVGWYVLLAGIAGLLYGRTFVRTGKIVPAALVHLQVDWAWSVLFAP